MNEPKQHHYIPRTYLENFCDEDGGLWVYDKWERRSFPSHPDSVLKQHMYYAQPDHKNRAWNYNIEHFFSCKIESYWPATVRIIQNGPKTTRELTNFYMFLYATRVRVPNCRKSIEYSLQQQVRVVSGMVRDKEYLENERQGIATINKVLNTNFTNMDELYDAGIINITIDPHRSLLAMVDLARGFSVVVSAIQLHFIKNCTSVDFNCCDNPIVYFPAGQSPESCQPYQFHPSRPFEFIFPITKKCCLYHNSLYPIERQQIVATETKNVDLVSRINRFVGAFADRYIVSSRELDTSQIPPTNNCPRLSVHKHSEQRGTLLFFQYEMGEPLRLPKWRHKFEAA
jgi:hypothetical protein